MARASVPLRGGQLHVPGPDRGLPDQVDVFFDTSPTFSLGADAAARGVKRIAWYDTKTPLRSGWAWGQNYLEGGVAAADARVGRGTVRLIGPEALFRAQPAGTQLEAATLTPAPVA